MLHLLMAAVPGPLAINYLSSPISTYPYIPMDIPLKPLTPYIPLNVPVYTLYTQNCRPRGMDGDLDKDPGMLHRAQDLSCLRV